MALLRLEGTLPRCRPQLLFQGCAREGGDSGLEGDGEGAGPKNQLPRVTSVLPTHPHLT